MVEQDDFFSLFGLPKHFGLDVDALTQSWRQVAAQVHPDKFALASAPERRVAMQWAARVNEAYRSLKDPLARARYMCEQAGIDLATETNTAMSPEFLVQQMQWREQLDDARDTGTDAAFDALADDIASARSAFTVALTDAIDVKGDYASAGERVREWMFVEKLAQTLAKDRPLV